MKVLKVILYSTESEKEKKEIQEWNIEQGK